MADCPNCGRQALRTKDWVCQWCGYPLISNSYKVIDKTFKEFQEERSRASKPSNSKDEFEFKLEYKPTPEPRVEPPLRPVYTPRPESVPPPQPQYNQTSLPLPEPITQSLQEQPEEPPPAPESVAQDQSTEIVAFPDTPPMSEPVTQNPPEQPVMITPPPPPQSEITPEPASPEPKPEMVIVPEPVPEPTLKPEDIQDGMEITTEEIDLLFRKDKEAANDGLTGKTILIKGVVDKIFVRDHLDIRYIMVTNAKKNMNWNLRCTFNKEELSKLSRLQEGQEVAVQGKYEGYSKNIIFKDCVLV